MNIRDLRKDEIEVRVASINKKGASLLLYKNARCDMSILDEIVGNMNWQRHHNRDNQNCIVSIYCKEKKQWIEKEDTGVESYTEKQKGLASDSFKRACFNWGIGTELYNAPFIYIPANKMEIIHVDGKYKTYDKFEVEKIKIENKNIIGLSIVNIKTKSRVFLYTK